MTLNIKYIGVFLLLSIDYMSKMITFYFICVTQHPNLF